MLCNIMSHDLTKTRVETIHEYIIKSYYIFINYTLCTFDLVRFVSFMLHASYTKTSFQYMITHYKHNNITSYIPWLVKNRGC